MATITAALGDDSASVEFDYDFGDSLETAVSKFTESVVWAYALRGLTVAAQGYARNLIKAGKSVEEIQTAMASWKPGTPRVTKSAEDKAREMLAALSPEARAQILKEIKAAKAA